mgnify:CR=1 FL=1
MITLIQVKTNGDIMEKKVKELNEETLYKHCNYKSDKDFEHIHTFTLSKKKYQVYGKKNGRANTENKYDFPPPIDTLLLFGTVCILKKQDEDFVSLTKEEWDKINQHRAKKYNWDLNKESTKRTLSLGPSLHYSITARARIGGFKKYTAECVWQNGKFTTGGSHQKSKQTL